MGAIASRRGASARRRSGGENSSLKDLATLGGWKDTQTLLKCYLKEDEAAMVEALRCRRSGSRSRGEGRSDAPGEAAARASDLRTPEPEE